MDLGPSRDAAPPGEVVVVPLLLVVGIVAMVEGLRLDAFASPRAAGTFPFLAGLVQSAGALVLLAGRLRRRGGEGTDAVAWLRRLAADLLPKEVALAVPALVVYVAALGTAGFVPATLVFLFCAIWYLRGGSPLWPAAVSIGTVASVWVVFRELFEIVLP